MIWSANDVFPYMIPRMAIGVQQQRLNCVKTATIGTYHSVYLKYEYQVS